MVWPQAEELRLRQEQEAEAQRQVGEGHTQTGPPSISIPTYGEHHF
jgi:hypothetical protein